VISPYPGAGESGSSRISSSRPDASEDAGRRSSLPELSESPWLPTIAYGLRFLLLFRSGPRPLRRRRGSVGDPVLEFACSEAVPPDAQRRNP
jgi:hypothetical protein